jgi:hypothetical protein
MWSDPFCPDPAFSKAARGEAAVHCLAVRSDLELAAVIVT